jgi:hypothetical protein
MSRILLSYDELTGISQYHNYDSATDTSVFESVGDAEPVLELNRKIANETEFTRKGIKDGWWLYASIPTIFQLKLLTEKGIDIYKKEHGARLSKVLEDPEYRHLKTTHKRHIIKE